MNRTLVVSSSAAGAQLVQELLPARDYSPVVVAGGGAEARRFCAESDFDLVIINAPLSDEFGHDLAVNVASQSAAGVVILVKNERADEVAARVETAGVFVIPKPVSRPFFFQAMRLVDVSHRRMLGLQRENRRLRTSIEEIRLIDRAKCALIQCLLMSEPHAHRYIEKQAMDLRCPKRQIAENILKTYEI